MAQPKISIIIPVYNAQTYLEKCLDSLFSQSERHIEIIAVDDGSQDSSPQILQRLAQQHQQLKILSQPNGGPGAARQLGLQHAQGAYIMFCDADDTYTPNMCAKMLQKIEEYNADWGVCDAQVEGVQSRNRTKELTHSRHDKYTPQNLPSLGMGLWCYIFRKSIINKFSIGFPPFFYGEDAAFINKYLCASSSYFILAEKLYVYNANDASLMGTVSQSQGIKRLTSSIGAQFDLYDFLQHHNLFPAHQNNYFDQLEKMIISISAHLQAENITTLIDKLQNFLQNLPVSKNFELLRAVKNGDIRHFQTLLRQTNQARTRRIKICGVSVIKITHQATTQTVFLFNIPIYKRHY